MAKNDSLTDSELFAIYCDGNQEALGIFHQRFAKQLLLRGYRLCEDEAIAADCVSDLFEQLLNYSSKERDAIFKGMEDENIKAWLYTAIKNRILDSLRKKLRQKKALMVLNRLLHYARFSNQINTYDDDFQRLAVLLSEREKEALELHLEGNSYQDIANKMQISPETVKTHLIRGKKRLKNIKDQI